MSSQHTTEASLFVSIGGETADFDALPLLTEQGPQNALDHRLWLSDDPGEHEKHHRAQHQNQHPCNDCCCLKPASAPRSVRYHDTPPSPAGHPPLHHSPASASRHASPLDNRLHVSMSPSLRQRWIGGPHHPESLSTRKQHPEKHGAYDHRNGDRLSSGPAQRSHRIFIG